VAAAKRRKRSAGNPTKRPSCSSIYIVLPSVQARTAAGSKEIGGSARMAFIVCFFQFLFIFKNEAFDLSQIMRSYASVACEENGRLQPEFAVSVRRPDMDMGRLTPLIGVEVETERSDAQNGRHEIIVPHATLHGNIFCQRRHCKKKNLGVSPAYYRFSHELPTMPSTESEELPRSIPSRSTPSSSLCSASVLRPEAPCRHALS